MTALCSLVENHGQLCCVAQMNFLGLLESPEFLVKIIFSDEYNLAGPSCKLNVGMCRDPLCSTNLKI